MSIDKEVQQITGDMQTGAEPQPVRCLCNKLLFIRYGNIIEIKCNKCKRMIRVFTRGIDHIHIE